MVSTGQCFRPMYSQFNNDKCFISYLEDKEVSFEDLENFLTEGVLMIDFKHENVLSLIGVVYEEGDRPLVVLPFMENGDLCTFIKRDEVVSHCLSSVWLIELCFLFCVIMNVRT